MKAMLRNIMLGVTLATLIGCAGGKSSGWGNFHGDIASQGYQAIDSGFALFSNWVSKPYRISSGSPVIGMDFQNREVIYLGTADARLVAIRSEDGSQKWQRWLGPADLKTAIVSSASVSDKGDIYVIVTGRDGDGSWYSTLYKVNQFGNLQWAYLFPDHRFTTGSPKTIALNNGTAVFVYLSVVTTDDIHGELFVVGDDGSRAMLLDRRSLAACDYGEPGSGRSYSDIAKNYEKIWGVVSTSPLEMDENGMVLPDNFIDPSVAVATCGEKPLIVVADNLCSIGAFEWNGTELSVLWQAGHAFKKHSSPAIFPDGLMVLGQGDGKVTAYDVQTGVKMWRYDAGRPVLATPAAPSKKLIFVVSDDHIQALSAADGTLVYDGTTARKLPLKGPTFSSPAVTANRLYVSSSEMMTLTHDFKTRGYDTHFYGNVMVSPAIGRDGAVYAVAADGTIHKYAGTR